jgi:hypothetical protein
MDVVLPLKEQDTPNYSALSCNTTKELFCQNSYNPNSVITPTKTLPVTKLNLTWPPEEKY